MFFKSFFAWLITASATFSSTFYTKSFFGLVFPFVSPSLFFDYDYDGLDYFDDLDY